MGVPVMSLLLHDSDKHYSASTVHTLHQTVLVKATALPLSHQRSDCLDLHTGKPKAATWRGLQTRTAQGTQHWVPTHC